MNGAHQRRFSPCVLMFVIVLLSSHCSLAQRSDFEAGAAAERLFLGEQSSSQQNLPPQPAPAPQPSSSQAGSPAAAQSPCVQPARIFIAEQYTGPFKNVVSYFVRKPEIKTVYVRRHPGGSRLCALTPSGKFHLFLRDSIHPVTFIAAGWNAGLSQADDDDPTFGQGAEGYGKRYAAALADHVSSDFFHTFVFPVIFRQDPRYYRQGYGSGRSRFAHAVKHVFVARSDDGTAMFNFSEWLATISAVALSNTYHPGNDRGVGPATGRIAANISTDAAVDVLREFWPEVVRKFKLPFRVESPAKPRP